MTSARVHAPARAPFFSRPVAIALGAALLALGLCIWQATLPGVFSGITGYDDGVYLGAAIRFVHGAMPYKDFVFVQPPGIVVVMSPVALIGRLIGDHDALLLARAITWLVTAINAGLVAWMVRGRGRFAMAVAGCSLAAFPLAVTADHSLSLEPYLVLFVLIGALVALSSDAPSLRRLLFAGVLFGLAGGIKLWALFPFLALLISFAPRWKTRVLPLFVGAAVGFAVLCLPFVIEAPHAFFHQVLAGQLSRGATTQNAVSPDSRLVAIVGLSGIPAATASVFLAEVLLGVLGVLVVIAFAIDRPGVHRTDEFVLLGAIASTVGIVAGPEFYPHYVYFTAPLLAVLLAIALSGCRRVLVRISGWVGFRRSVSRVAAVATLVGASAALVWIVGEDAAYARTSLPAIMGYSPDGLVDSGPAIDTAIPKGACVVFDEPILAIEANRFTSFASNCPQLVDPYGMWLADSGGLSPTVSPPYPTDFVATWQSYFNSADYVVLSVPLSDNIPWTPALTQWFNTHFVRILAKQDAYVYFHDVGAS